MMKARFCALVICLFFVIGICPLSVNAAQSINTLYVAVDGSDDNIGSIDAPFATFERARDEIRKIKSESGLPEGGICVYFRGGTYNRIHSFELTAEDSGTENSPITYRAYPGEDVKVTGGLKIEPSSFTKTTDKAVTDRIYEKSARDKIYQVDLTTYGIEELDPVQHIGVFQGHIEGYSNSQVKSVYDASSELFINDKPAPMAGWPNDEGYATYDMSDIVNREKCGPGGPEHLKFRYKNDRIKNWLNAKDHRLYGFWGAEWCDYSMELASYEDGIVEVNGPIRYSPTGDGRRFRAYNLMEELDSPGEFYADRETKILYLYPPEGLANAEIYFSVFKESLFSMSCSYVNIKNINLTSCRGHAMSISGSYNTVSYCTIYNTSVAGINVKGNNNGILSNFVHDTNNGIIINGGDRNVLTPANNYAENNVITRWCRLTKTSTHAIRVNGVGNRVSHNKIYDAEQIAIQFVGNDHLIEYNEIYNVCQVADDVAAVYTGKNVTYRGNRFENNYVHDIVKGTSVEGNSGIYMDDQMCSVSITGNLFENIQGTGVKIAGGRNHLVKQNVFINCGSIVTISNRNAGEDYVNMDSTNHRYWAIEGLLEVPYTEGIWAERYPELVNILEDDLGAPKYNTVTDNFYINSSQESIAAQAIPTGTFKNNMPALSTDVFEDYENGNLALKPDTEAYKNLLDFPKIDKSVFGTYAEAFHNLMSNRILLAVGMGGAITKSELKMIDEGNAAVVPFVKDDRTFVPLRFIAESMNAQVEWDGNEQKISISLDGKQIEMKIDSDEILVDGEKKQIDSPALLLDGRTFVPLRAVAETFEKDVFWDDKGLIIISDSKDAVSMNPAQYLIDEAIRQLNLR